MNAAVLSHRLFSELIFRMYVHSTIRSRNSATPHVSAACGTDVNGIALVFYQLTVNLSSVMSQIHDLRAMSERGRLDAPHSLLYL